jgi:hypothetical protein
MAKHDHVLLTAEERDLIELWLERPAERRTLGDVPQFTEWVLAHQPHLLPKGPDDASEYLARVLADSIQG